MRRTPQPVQPHGAGLNLHTWWLGCDNDLGRTVWIPKPRATTPVQGTHSPCDIFANLFWCMTIVQKLLPLFGKPVSPSSNRGGTCYTHQSDKRQFITASTPARPLARHRCPFHAWLV